MTTSTFSISEKVASYTEIREAADVLVGYLNSASLSDTISISSAFKEATTKDATNVSVEDGAISELLLSNTEPIPLIDAIEKKKSEGQFSTSGITYITAEKRIVASHIPDGLDKKVSLFYHTSQANVDISSCLTDISAVFCNLIPNVEMSRCVPYFDLRVLYPKGDDKIGALNPMRFLGVPPDSKQVSEAFGKESFSAKTSEAGKIGFDVAGMEIFCMPQTLAASNAALNGVDAVSLRGVNVLNPITPLLTIESANIQQTGINGSFYAQTKIDLNLVLHDRSRLVDIAPIISVDIFPTVTFKVSYGWSHPDTNKMTGNPYAKLLNSMKFTQLFSVYSVSISTRDATSLSIKLSLVSMGSMTAKGAKIASAVSRGRFIPYSALQTLVKQYVTLKTNYSKSTSNSNDKTIVYQAPPKIGSTIIASTSPGSNSNKFILTEKFYDFYNTLTEIMKGGQGNESDQSKVDSIVKALNDAIPVDDSVLVNASTGIFDFKETTSPFKYFDYSTNTYPFSAASIGKFLIPSSLSSTVKKIASNSGYGTQNSYVTLSCAIGKLVAVPLLNSIPDVSEVRIHCFSFNSACGQMAKENIGNFPIVLNLMQDREETKGDKKKKIAGLGANSSTESALQAILAQVNNTASPFYGFSEIQKNLDKAVEGIRDSYKSEDLSALSDEDKQFKAKNAQDSIDAKVAESKQKIADLNKSILKSKNIDAGQDPSFIPPRIKSQIDVLEAYDATEDPSSASKKIIRIMLYDERASGFSKLASLVFAMANASGVTQVVNPVPSELSEFVTNLGSDEKDPNVSIIALKSRKDYREIASRMFPNLIVGSDSGCITNATFSSQPSGDVASSYLLTALSDEPTAATSNTATNNTVSDVLVIPSTVNINMLGNVCIARGQTYFVDFGTGTTLDQAYTVSAVSHAIKPGSFTTSVSMIPTSNATVKTIDRQISELTKIIQNTK